MTSTPDEFQPINRRSIQARAVQGAFWTGIHTLVSLPLAFGVNILLARVLGVEGYGRLAYLTTVITIATIMASLGVTTALVQFGSKAHASGQVDKVRLYLSGAQGFRLLVTGPLVTVAVLTIVQVDPWLLALAVVFGVGMPALMGNAQPALRIENRTDRVAQLAMIGNVITQGLVVAALLLVGTADAVWSARLIAVGMLLALPLISISKLYRGAVLQPRPPWRLPRYFWRFAAPTGLASVIGALTTNRLELVLLDWFADPVSMGLFGLAFGLAVHVYAPAQALVGPLVPAVSGLAEIDSASVRIAFLRTSRVSSTVGGLLVAGPLPALAILVPVIYGDAFDAASDHLVVLGLAGAALLIGSPHHAFLTARLKGYRVLWINLLVLGVNLVLALSLIPLVGIWGATIASASAMIMRTAMLSTGEAKALSIPLRTLFQSLLGVIAGIATSSLLWITLRTSSASPIILAMIALLVGTVTFLIALRLIKGGTTIEDVNAITKSLPRRLRTPARVAMTLTAHQKRC